MILVWIASFYANAESGFGTSEAADNHELKEEIAYVRKQTEQILYLLQAKTPDSSQ